MLQARKKSLVLRKNIQRSSQQTEVILDANQISHHRNVSFEEINMDNHWLNRPSEKQAVDCEGISNDVGVQNKNRLSYTLDETEITLNDRKFSRNSRQSVISMRCIDIDTLSMIEEQFISAEGEQKENQHPSNNVNEIGTDYPPIIEYAAEPLLPLREACVPLVDILYDLWYYVQIALNETPEHPPHALTVNESAAIRLYTIEWDAPHRSLYSMLNYTLKNGNREELRPYHKYMKLFLSALVKIPCTPSTTVWRGVTKDLSEEFPPDTYFKQIQIDPEKILFSFRWFEPI